MRKAVSMTPHADTIFIKKKTVWVRLMLSAECTNRIKTILHFTFFPHSHSMIHLLLYAASTHSFHFVSQSTTLGQILARKPNPDKTTA
jgi:hypothetical protein